jgi:hypothetical protein
MYLAIFSFRISEFFPGVPGWGGAKAVYWNNSKITRNPQLQQTLQRINERKRERGPPQHTSHT